MALINKLTTIADAIRTKTGNTNKLSLDQMAVAISGIDVKKPLIDYNAFSFLENLLNTNKLINSVDFPYRCAVLIGDNLMNFSVTMSNGNLIKLFIYDDGNYMNSNNFTHVFDSNKVLMMVQV